MRAPAFLRRLVLGAAAALLLAGLAQAAEITGLRVWPDQERTRAVLDLSGPVDYKLFQLSGPDRIVLDVRGSRFGNDFETRAEGGALKGVRAGRHGKGDARIVFDLAAGAHPKSFLLPPGDGAGYRLVVDLYPAAKAAAPAQPVKRASEPLPGKARDIVIAIDAGHGGKDPGSIGASGTFEKRITLQVARELKALIDATPGMQAVLTRDGDYFIPLEQRYAKARAAKADLFISVHADAFTNKDARGSSVWVLSPRGATSEQARWLADRENRADLVGGVSLDDKDDTLAKVLLDLSQGATMGASNAVAEHVLAALAKVGPVHRTYVERANFVVLRSPDVPSILVETAFITNPAEEARLKTPAHREKLAAAILDGVKNHFYTSPPPGSLFALERTQGKRRAIERYVVTRGDTLSAIAARHGVTTAQLRAANALPSERVRVGEVLAIPSG
ncbi:N-acetylmuramoyl-L-alanine amidase [Dokdonella sp.]|uniref:N-acetylmuramoyl-L-alanine amidase n=1 Tax=Dokdonella sp. TaxID=2291710 RepID=UPI0031C75BDB|nr:N-acetylmuramoyl-L-alanine amidase [Dokdonella sp.]